MTYVATIDASLDATTTSTETQATSTWAALDGIGSSIASRKRSSGMTFGRARSVDGTLVLQAGKLRKVTMGDDGLAHFRSLIIS